MTKQTDTSAVPEPAPRVLVVEDDPLVRRSLADWLGVVGLAVEQVESGAAALARLGGDMPDVVLSDVRMPGMSGIELLAEIQRRDPGLPVVLVTGHGDVPLAVAAMRSGAHDFVTKPYDPDHLLAILLRASRERRLALEITRLRDRLGEGEDAIAATLIGSSRVMEQLRATLRKLAMLPSDVLLYGETGTGKDVAAQALHAASARRKGPFVALNCAAIPMDLAESELFGHEDGAFTGARGARPGKFEAADGGTLFLDEIESMPPALQAKVLRVLQERKVERLGGHRSIPVDIRVIAAAKEDLRTASEAGRFRPDLYFRLAGAEVSLPPLREREEDALLLFNLFASRAAQAQGLPRPMVRPGDAVTLLAHPWRGNVREVKSLAERFAYGLVDGGLAVGLPAAGQGLEERLAAYERRLIEAALEACSGSVAAAAEHLGLPRRTLGDRMARLGLERPR
jgi:two-component system C4-dicarboxylate transport response regulator DctD